MEIKALNFNLILSEIRYKYGLEEWGFVVYLGNVILWHQAI